MRVLDAPVRRARAVDRRSTFSALLEAARPKQWTKNLVVFAPLIFGGELLQTQSVRRATGAALLFCATTSAVYLFNDLCDSMADRLHPLKARRPIPSGRLGRSTAVAGSLTLMTGALAGAWLIQPRLALVLLGYAGLMAGYSLWLKHVVIVDVVVIAVGFVLRAAAGAVVIGVPLSPWLYLCTILLSLFLGFGKRRHELALLETSAATHRRNLEHYSVALLDRLIAIVAAATIMAYSLYTLVAPSVPANHAMALTIPFVLFGIGRYLYLVHAEDGGGAPDQLLLDDRPLLITILLWGTSASLIFYLA